MIWPLPNPEGTRGRSLACLGTLGASKGRGDARGVRRGCGGQEAFERHLLTRGGGTAVAVPVAGAAEGAAGPGERPEGLPVERLSDASLRRWCCIIPNGEATEGAALCSPRRTPARLSARGEGRRVASKWVIGSRSRMGLPPGRA